jgi:type 1 glutamine amidotransferase
VALHFAVDAWEDWAEYRSMIGRYWVRRQGGKKVSGHGPKGPFRVVIADKTHAVTDGLGDFEIDDELYAKLQGTGPIHVLAGADSDWSGKTEPLAWTVTYGEGRVFVLALGHDVAARRSAGFQRLLARGCEWAARRAAD